MAALAGVYMLNVCIIKLNICVKAWLMDLVIHKGYRCPVIARNIVFPGSGYKLEVQQGVKKCKIVIVKLNKLLL